MKKVVLLIFLLTFNAHADPLKKCSSHFGKLLAKEIGISFSETIKNVLFLGLLTRQTIPQYKYTHRLNKVYTAINEIRKNRKWGLGIKSLANNLGLTPNEVIKLSKEKPELFCNDVILRSPKPYETLLSEVRYYLSVEKRVKKYKNLLFNKSWVSLKNPFKTLDKSTYHSEYFFKDCLSKSYGNHPVEKMAEGRSKEIFKDLTYQKVHPDCTPDVLFNWSNPGFLSNLKSVYSNKVRTWTTFLKTSFGDGVNPNALFTTFSPLATYGYGSENLRLKLKKETKFYFITKGKAFHACNTFPKNVKETTVFIRSFGHAKGDVYMEYLLCSFGPVHSWSYGQEETYNEEVRQYNWIRKDPKQQNYILYMHRFGKPILYLGNLDKIEFGPNLLRERMTYSLSNLMLGKTGEIFYNPTLPTNKRTPREHFRLDKPIYWNVIK